MQRHPPSQKNRLSPSAEAGISHCDIAIVGGGASGMAAAWYGQRSYLSATGKRCSISIFERNDRLGKKLLATGNGRCNLTNLEVHPDRYHGNDTGFTQTAFLRFPPKTVIALFEEMGVVCTVAEEQKVFPMSLHAGSVLDALRLALHENGIRHVGETMIVSLSKSGNRFNLTTVGGTTFTATSVIIATGGRCAPATGSDGNGYTLLTAISHTLISPRPSIVQLKTDTRFVRPLSGHKIRGTASLFINRHLIRKEHGEILFTDYGLSGPPILQLSGYVARSFPDDKENASHSEVTIELDFLPGHSLDEVKALLYQRKHAFATRNLEEYLTGLFHRRLAYGIIKASINKPLSAATSALTDRDINALAYACKAFSIIVTGTMSFAHAQTTAGGIATCDFDPATMESYRCAGIFACGEVLDIDGDCGGFNLQWAWASGFLAGNSAAIHLLDQAT